MLIDHNTKLKYRLYETGQITCTRSGAGNRKAKGGRVIGKKQKKFNVEKKIVRSTIIRQFNIRTNTIKFITLTFPDDVTNKYANGCFSKFVENLKKNYNLNSYVAVKELTKIGRPHFHCFLDMPYINYTLLNRAWCHTFYDNLGFSPNALQTRKGKSIIKTIRRACNYASKYVSKAPDIKNNPEYANVTDRQLADYVCNRLFFCDNFVKSSGYIISSGIIDYLLGIQNLKCVADDDYFSVYFIKKFTPSLYMMEKFVTNYRFLCLILREKDLNIFYYSDFLLFFF